MPFVPIPNGKFINMTILPDRSIIFPLNCCWKLVAVIGLKFRQGNLAPCGGQIYEFVFAKKIGYELQILQASCKKMLLTPPPTLLVWNSNKWAVLCIKKCGTDQRTGNVCTAVQLLLLMLLPLPFKEEKVGLNGRFLHLVSFSRGGREGRKGEKCWPMQGGPTLKMAAPSFGICWGTRKCENGLEETRKPGGGGGGGDMRQMLPPGFYYLWVLSPRHWPEQDFSSIQTPCIWYTDETFPWLWVLCPSRSVVLLVILLILPFIHIDPFHIWIFHFCCRIIWSLLVAALFHWWTARARWEKIKYGDRVK